VLLARSAQPRVTHIKPALLAISYLTFVSIIPPIFLSLVRAMERRRSVSFNPAVDIREIDDSSSSASESPHVATPPTLPTTIIPTPKGVNLFVHPSLKGRWLMDAVRPGSIVSGKELDALADVAATEPPIGGLTVKCEGFKSTIGVRSYSEVGVLTVRECILQLRQCLRDPVDNDEYYGPHEQEITTAFRNRVGQDTVEYGKGVCRVDLLLGREIAGLEILSAKGDAKLILQ
jgi:hypothetical protein